MRLALGAVVELVLPQLLLTSEGFQTTVQADGLGLGPTGLLHTAVLLYNLQGDHHEGLDADTMGYFQSTDNSPLCTTHIPEDP